MEHLGGAVPTCEDAPRGDTTGFASWYGPLWFEEPLTFQAFPALLGVPRFFGVPEKDTIEALLTEQRP